MVEHFHCTLRAWDRHGSRIKPNEFLERLRIKPGDPVEVEDGPGVPRIRLFAVSMVQFEHVDTTNDAGAQSEAFAAALHNGLVKAAEWLTCQPPDVFEDLRAVGRVTDVFIGGWMTQNQFDLDLPPELLLACGRLGLSLSICTND